MTTATGSLKPTNYARPPSQSSRTLSCRARVHNIRATMARDLQFARQIGAEPSPLTRCIVPE